MSFTVSHYQSSQKFNLVLTLGFFLVGIIAAIILGIIYSVISYYSPIMLLNIVIVVGLGLALGIITTQFAKLAKVRNTVVKFVMGFFFCLFAYYSRVCAFEISLLSGDPLDYVELFLSPFSVFDIMFNVILPNREIAITKGSTTSNISCFVLAILYFIEFLLFFCPLIVVLKIDDYYCEDCQVWYQKYRFFSSSIQNLESNITNNITGSYADVLSQLTFFSAKKGFASQVDQSADSLDILVHHYSKCPKCQQKSILSIYKNLLEKGKKGQEFKLFRKGILVENAYIDNKTDALFVQQIAAYYQSK